MDLKAILQKHNTDESLLDELEADIKKEIGTEFVPKTQYSKKTSQLSELQDSFEALQAEKIELEANKNYKEEYDKLTTEYTNYKNKVEKESSIKTKKDIINKSLIKEGFNADIVDLLIDKFDYENVEIENNEVKGWSEIVTPYKNKYKNFIAEVKQEGASPFAPPNNNNKSFTMETIKNMSVEDIKKNYESIKQGLNSQGGK